MITRHSPLEIASIALTSISQDARERDMPGTGTWLDILSERLGQEALDADEQVADGLDADEAEKAALRRLLSPRTQPVLPLPHQEWTGVQVTILLFFILLAFLVGAGAERLAH